MGQAGRGRGWGRVKEKAEGERGEREVDLIKPFKESMILCFQVARNVYMEEVHLLTFLCFKK